MRRRKVSSSFSVTTIHDGNDGYNNAVVTIYQRKASAPSVPSSVLIYSFVTGLLTPASSLSGWSLSIPDVDGNPCWVTQASVRSKDSSVTIGSADWGTVRKLVEDGKNCIRLDLSNEHEDFLYDDAGNNRSGSATSQARLYDGITEVNASDINWSIDASKSSGVLIDASSSDFSTNGTSVSSAGLLTVKALTAAVAKVTVKAEYPKSSGKCYYAEFTANKTSQDKYDLVIKPNSIAYNPISYTTQTIDVSAKRLDLSGTPSAATISTTSGSGLLRLFRSYVNNDGTLTTAEQLTSLSQSIDSTTANSYAGVYFELRKYANASGSNSSSYSVADYETVPITKAQNGAHGDTPITAYRWYKSGLTPTKPTDVSDDKPDAVDYLNDDTNAQPTTAWSNTAPNRPADGWHLWIVQSTKHTAANGNVTRDAWSDPVRISGDKGSPGEDAAGREWIYKLSSSSVPSIPSTSNNTDGYVPSGWTNHPTGIDATNIYEYACYRDKAAGTGTRTWSGWKGKTGGASGDKPILWSHWGRNGMDGDGTEYVFIRTKTNVKPTILDTGNPDSAYIYDNAKYLDSNGGLDNEDEFLPIASVSSGTIEANNVASGNNGNGVSGGTTRKFGECTDDPKGISEEWPYEWAIKRTKAEPDANGVRSWNVFAGEMSLWARWANDGTSPWVADLDNEMDSVSCDDTGHPVSEQTVRTVLSLFHGAAGKTFDTPTVQRNGTAVEYDVNANGVTVQLSGTTLQIVYQTSAQISGKDDYTITLTATDDNTVTRTLHFIVNGVIGDVYNLLPSANQLNIASGQATASLACGYKKNVNGTITEYPNETGIIDTKYRIFFRRRLKSTGAFETYYILYSGTGTYHGNARTLLSSLNVSVYDAVEFYLCTSTSSSARSIDGKSVYYATSLTNVIDREAVPVVSDGAHGDSPEVYSMNPSRTSIEFHSDGDGAAYTPPYIDVTCGYAKTVGGATTPYEWPEPNGYITIDGVTHHIVWRKYNASGNIVPTYDGEQTLGWDRSYANSSDPTAATNDMGDGLIRLNGGIRVKNTCSYSAIEFAIAKKAPNAITSEADIIARVTIQISKKSDGDTGEKAVSYSISLAGSTFYRDPNTDTIYVNIKGKVYKHEGGTTTVYTSLTRGELSMFFLTTDGDEDPVPNVNSLTNGYTVSSGTFASKFYNGSGYSNECAFVVVLNVGGEQTRESVQIETYGTNGVSVKGDTGRMYYLAGIFPDKAPYYRTTDLCPVVYYRTKWWYLNAASAASSDEPSDNSTSKWKELLNFGVVLTEAIFVKQYAQFCAAIITGDWLISCHGTIGGVAYGGTVEEPEEYNGRAAYTYFDPIYPDGYDPFSLAVTNDDITVAYASSWTKITNNFKLVAGSYTFKITCHVESGSTIHLRLFAGDSTVNDYYLTGTTSTDLVTLSVTKTLGSSRSDWNLRAATDAANQEGYIVSIEIEPEDIRFVPNYAVDLKTGRTYQHDAHIRGTITTVGANSKVVISDGVIEFYGLLNFPNIVLGVDSDGCAVLNFYDKNGNFKYGLGPDKIFETRSQSESMTLKYYGIDESSDDVTGLETSDFVWLYRYMFKSETPAALKGLYKYLAKIVAGVYGPGNYCASQADAQAYDGKIIKYGYSSSTKLRNSDLFAGGVVVTSGRTQSGVITRLSSLLNNTSVDELDYRGYVVMQDSDFNRTKSGDCYYYTAKSNSANAFYYDVSSLIGSVGYYSSYSDKWTLNLCVDPRESNEDTFIDPIYWFSLLVVDDKGQNAVSKTLYINKSKLNAILVAAGYSL